MSCPVCGKEPPCAHVRGVAAFLMEQHTASDEPAGPESNSTQDPPRETSWRREVVSRVQLHRARRHKRGHGDGAMEFDFGPEEALAVTEEPVVRGRLSRYAATKSHLPPAGDTDRADEDVAALITSEPPKVIRFPRQPAIARNQEIHDWRFQPEPSQPLPDMPPRILDDVEPSASDTATPYDTPDYLPQVDRAAAAPPPEQMELLPSFDDIRLESAHIRAQTESEAVPRPASLQERFIAGAVDVTAVVLAVVVFEITFVYLAEDNPHSRVALLCGLCVSAALWVLFQYLFLVHGQGTPGMRLAELELATFDGKPVTRYACRWRALASTLSALALGLGYAWALVDEDQLGWHDRITETLVCSHHQRPAAETELWG